MQRSKLLLHAMNKYTLAKGNVMAGIDLFCVSAVIVFILSPVVETLSPMAGAIYLFSFAWTGWTLLKGYLLVFIIPLIAIAISGCGGGDANVVNTIEIDRELNCMLDDGHMVMFQLTNLDTAEVFFEWRCETKPVRVIIHCKPGAICPIIYED